MCFKLLLLKAYCFDAPQCDFCFIWLQKRSVLCIDDEVDCYHAESGFAHVLDVGPVCSPNEYIS